MNKKKYASTLLMAVVIGSATIASCSSAPIADHQEESYGQVTGKLRVDALGGTIGVTTAVDFRLECDGDVVKTGTIPVPLDGSSISGHFGSVPPANDCQVILETTLTLSAEPFSVPCAGTSSVFDVLPRTTVDVSNILIECNIDRSSEVSFTGDIALVNQSLDTFFVGPTSIVFDPSLPAPPVTLLIGEPAPDPGVDYVWSVAPSSGGQVVGCDTTPENCQFFCEEAGTHTLRLTANFGGNTRFREVDVTCATGSDTITIIETAAAAGTVTTGSAATDEDPVITAVTMPAGGTVVIVETTPTESEPPGYSFLGQQINITVNPPGTVENPLVIEFELDDSVLGGNDCSTLEVFKNGTLIEACTGAPQAVPDPCVSVCVDLPGGNVRVTVLTSEASSWNFGVEVPPEPVVLLEQDWTNTGLITLSNNWSGVPGITGYRGDGMTSATAVNPQTVLADGSGTPVNVIANETNLSLATGGVAEFHIANPVVALQGSGTARAPHLVLTVNTTGYAGITVAYNLRDIDSSADNAVQPVALQYRVGGTGNYTNVPEGFVADASTGPSLATLVTPINVTLPPAVNNQSQVEVRIIITDAAGSDEWIGIDDILITGTPSDGGNVPPTVNAGGPYVVTPDGTITLSATVVDPDDTALDILWTVESEGPSFIDPTLINAELLGNDAEPGEYVLTPALSRC